MENKQNSAAADTSESRKRPSVSEVFDDGMIVEPVYDPKDKRTAFAVWQDGKWRLASSYPVGKKQELIPYSPNNNLIKKAKCSYYLLHRKNMVLKKNSSKINDNSFIAKSMSLRSSKSCDLLRTLFLDTR